MELPPPKKKNKHENLRLFYLLSLFKHCRHFPDKVGIENGQISEKKVVFILL